MEVFVIRVICRHLSLSEIEDCADLTAYHDIVKPLSLDLCLERNAEYLVMGILERDGTPWVYVVPAEGDIELEIHPAAMFSFDEAPIPPGMIIRISNTPQPSLEIIHQSLSHIDNWFERYIDGDEVVENIIKSEINKFRQTL